MLDYTGMGVNSEKYGECFPHKSRPTLRWAYIKVGAAKLSRNLRIVTSPTACYEYFLWSQWLIPGGSLIRRCIFLWEADVCVRLNCVEWKQICGLEASYETLAPIYEVSNSQQTRITNGIIVIKIMNHQAQHCLKTTISSYFQQSSSQR